MASYSSTVLSDAPHSYFHMDDADGSMANATGNSAGFHLANPALGAEGALSAESPNRAVTYFASPDEDKSQFTTPGYDRYSIELWVWTGQASPDASADLWHEGIGLVDGEISGNTTDTGIAMIRNGSAGFGVGPTDVTLESTTPINDGFWHHIVGTNDGAGVIKLYVDGELEDEDNTADGAPRTSTTLNIGALANNNGHLAGIIDEVAFYTADLTAADVTEHFEAAQPAPSAPPAPPAQPVPPGRLTVFPSGGGSGEIAGPGLWCFDIGSFMSGGGDCEESYAAGTQVTLTPLPHPDSRFSSFYNVFQNECQRQTNCTFVVQSGVAHSIGAIFHLTAAALAEALSNDGSSKVIERTLDDSVNPARKRQIKFPDIALTSFGSEIGNAGGALVTLIPKDQVKLLGANTATLVGNAGNTLVSKAPLISDNGSGLISDNGSGLIGGYGGNLIGPDGATLISDNGSGVISDNGLGRIRALGSSKPKPRRKFKAFAIGGYAATLSDSGNAAVVFELSKQGREIIDTFGRLNLELKRTVALNASLVELVQPADKRGAGGALTTLKIK